MFALFWYNKKFPSSPYSSDKEKYLNDYVMNKSTVQMQHFKKIYLMEILIKFPSCLPLMVDYIIITIIYKAPVKLFALVKPMISNYAAMTKTDIL